MASNRVNVTFEAFVEEFQGSMERAGWNRIDERGRAIVRCEECTVKRDIIRDLRKQIDKMIGEGYHSGTAVQPSGIEFESREAMHDSIEKQKLIDRLQTRNKQMDRELQAVKQNSNETLKLKRELQKELEELKIELEARRQKDREVAEKFLGKKKRKIEL